MTLDPKINFNVTTRDYSVYDMVVRAWGSEYNIPDRGAYEFSNGRRFDSTDKNNTGIYRNNHG